MKIPTGTAALQVLKALQARRREQPPQQRSHGPWVVAAFALLLVAAVLFGWSRAGLSSARQALDMAQQRLAEVRQEEARTTHLAQRTQMAHKLLRDAARQGLGHQDWAERRFNIQKATMRREEANALLAELVRAPDRFFGAEGFELSVLRRTESLFSDVQDPDSRVEVSVRGSLMFRISGGGS